MTRECTERSEGVADGVARVVGTSEEAIAAEAGRLLQDPRAHHEMAQPTTRYGDGRAAGRIVEALKKSLVL